MNKFPYLLFIFYLVSFYFSINFMAYINDKNNYSLDYYNIHENNEYDLYRKLYRESVYSQYPNMTYIILILKSIFVNKNIKINVFIDIIRLYTIAYRRTLKNQICGDISESPSQMLIYYKYAKSINKDDANICEIGFLYGVSSLIFIVATGLSSKYYGFDYGHNQSQYIFSLLSKNFNMKMMWGKSQITVPKSNLSIICDIVHIDGSHIIQFIYQDIVNMKIYSNKKTLLIVDDINDNNIAWKKLISDKIIYKEFCSKYKSFCIGKYI